MCNDSAGRPRDVQQANMDWRVKAPQEERSEIRPEEARTCTLAIYNMNYHQGSLHKEFTIQWTRGSGHLEVDWITTHFVMIASCLSRAADKSVAQHPPLRGMQADTRESGC